MTELYEGSVGYNILGKNISQIDTGCFMLSFETIWNRPFICFLSFRWRNSVVYQRDMNQYRAIAVHFRNNYRFDIWVEAIVLKFPFVFPSGPFRIRVGRRAERQPIVREARPLTEPDKHRAEVSSHLAHPWNPSRLGEAAYLSAISSQQRLRLARETMDWRRYRGPVR